jgi:alkylhydroperoxidase family enzyme
MEIITMNRQIHNLPLSAITDIVVKDYLSLPELISQSDFEPKEQDLIFLTIMQEYHCDYCSHVHQDDVGMGEVTDSLEQAVLAAKASHDHRLTALDLFLRALILQHDTLSTADLEAFLSAGFTQKNVMELSTALSMKAISDYTKHIA